MSCRHESRIEKTNQIGGAVGKGGGERCLVGMGQRSLDGELGTRGCVSVECGSVELLVAGERRDGSKEWEES